MNRSSLGLLVLGSASAALSILLLGVGGAEPSPPPGEEASIEHVVLLHGLGRSARAMRPLERSLAEAGYRVHNLDYPSTRHTPEELVDRVAREIDRCCREAQRLHFVTHSMGGILVRAYLAEHAHPALGRVVMLAPPNRGSEYVDMAGDWAWFGQLLGPTALQLGTDPESLPNRLPEPDFELGVIAGTGGIHWIGDVVIAGENDGTVSVASTQVAGMRDFIAVDASHTFIMRDDEVTRQTLAFLRNGAFERKRSSSR